MVIYLGLYDLKRQKITGSSFMKGIFLATVPVNVNQSKNITLDFFFSNLVNVTFSTSCIPVCELLNV